MFWETGMLQIILRSRMEHREEDGPVYAYQTRNPGCPQFLLAGDE